MPIKLAFTSKGIASWLGAIRENIIYLRQLRFAFGVTIAVLLAYAIEWPLAFLLPVLSATLLALPLPKPSLQATLNNMFSTLKAFTLGLLFSLVFLRYPSAYILLLGLTLFHLYYYLNRGGSFWLTLMSILAVLILPMIANSHQGLAIGVSVGFIYSSWLTMAMIWLVHFIFPDPAHSAFPPLKRYQRGYSKIAAQRALKSAAVAFPIAAIFISYGLSDYLLVMIFAALFILKPELTEGKEAGRNSLISTLLGGGYAWCFYWLIVAVPEFHFFILLLLATSLFFAHNIFSQNKLAKYYSSAFIAMLVVVNSSMAAGANFNEIFFNRILLISLAIIYIICALKVIERFFKGL